jgi:hypothetical protein
MSEASPPNASKNCRTAFIAVDNESREPRSPRWNIAETRRLISELYGNHQLEIAKPALSSVVARLGHARYHFQEIKALLSQTLGQQFDMKRLYEAVFFVDPKARDDLDECTFKVEAHMVACAQAIHSIPDTLAHVVYYGLALNRLWNWQARVISYKKLLAKLEKLNSDTGQYQSVLTALKHISTTKEFEEIEATANHHKHRGIPETLLALQPEGSVQPYAMEFGSFNYLDTFYPNKEISELLAPAYDAMSQSVVATGNAINAVLVAQSLPSTDLLPTP